MHCDVHTTPVLWTSQYRCHVNATVQVPLHGCIADWPVGGSSVRAVTGKWAESRILCSTYLVRHGFIYGCVYDTGTRTHFTRSVWCLPTPIPTLEQAHSTSTIRPLMWRRLRNGTATCQQCSLPAALPVLVAEQHYFTFLPILHTLRSFTQCDVLLFFSSSVRYVEN